MQHNTVVRDSTMHTPTYIQRIQNNAKQHTILHGELVQCGEVSNLIYLHHIHRYWRLRDVSEAS